MTGALRLAIAAVVVGLGLASRGFAASLVPPTLVDVGGTRVDVAALAARSHLVFVTVKATWCPVCREQLRRLGRALPRLRACGATFVVLVPGTREAVATLAHDTSFPYPFVADEARAIAGAAGFAGDDAELVPGLFAVDAARAVTWRQRGRADGAYGDGALAAWLGCPAAGPDLLTFAPRGAW